MEERHNATINDHKKESDNEQSNRKRETDYYPLLEREKMKSSVLNKSERITNSTEVTKTKRKKKPKRKPVRLTEKDSFLNQAIEEEMEEKVGHKWLPSTYDNTEGHDSNDRLRQFHQSLLCSPIALKPDIRELAIEQALKCQHREQKEVWHYDYVLVYKTGDNHTVSEKLRHRFEEFLHKEGFKIARKYTTERTYVVLHCSFERLCEEAEHVTLQMPLAGFVVPGSDKSSCWDHFKTDNTVDFVSAPFCVSKKHIYEGIENIDTFFRPALRSLLVHHILQNMDVREKEERSLGQNPQGLAYMLMEKAYSDAFILHERSLSDTSFALSDRGDDPNGFWLHGQDVSDPRTALNYTWLNWFKYQPLWKIRNYFGEKIALYFAWLGLLASSLIVPSLLGLSLFLWGLGVAIRDNSIRSDNDSNRTLSQTIQLWAKNAFDNDATPFFALIVCLWGTLFLELWKRQNSTVAYEWDVSDFEEQEPNRPQFYGTKIRTDPVTGDEVFYYPFGRQFVKMSGSFCLMLFMVCLVLASLFAVIVYRVVSREDYFKNSGTAGSLLSSVTSTFLNTLSIMIMQKVYQKLALKLTSWENHRTQTAYEDALIIKLFGFQFVNSYTSLFYIAFFREGTAGSGILGFGQRYNDACGDSNDCMTLLSLQVAMLMIMKPLPKLFSDVILPWLKKQWRLGLCRCCGNSSKVEQDPEGGGQNHAVEDYLERERNKEPLGDFTLSEYNEKVLQYGFLMLFAAAFPLAPLIALLTNAIDMRVDARRLLWTNRRPVAFRAEDIGMWYAILHFLNLVGVVTNAFLIAFTSQYGRKWEGETKVMNANQTVVDPMTNITSIILTVTRQPASGNRLWIVIMFEHIVLAVKFFIAWVIPDTPANIDMAKRRQKYQVAEILSKAGVRRGPGKTITDTATARNDHVESENELFTHGSNAKHMRNVSSPGFNTKGLHHQQPILNRSRSSPLSKRVPDPLPATYVTNTLKQQYHLSQDSEA